ncbi:hypothetical protein [Streptodolium elevatio]|uniref:Uncharacterized protein n=1 Tax=Streptodolium elevatio TaxID=3157996 RepID=A0ABV3DV76_9ACTN
MLNMELEHLRLACDLMREHDGREPEDVLAPELPAPVTFEPNKQYLRDLIADELDLTTLGTGYVREAHERFASMQEALNGEQPPPSDRVMTMHQEAFGREHRLETEGKHPVKSLREKS